MGLLIEELKERRNDSNVKYIAKNIVNKDKEKPFVFISYKSNDWKIVLKDVVYRLVKYYGLNVYFDGDFDTHNSLWVKQFPENMDSPYCKGVIAFISNKYVRSYATLMELMHSQTYDASGKLDAGLPVVPINIETTMRPSTNSLDYIDTGLGRKEYDDGSVNSNAAAEKYRFDQDFRELVKRKKILSNAEYIYKYENLKVNGCFDIFQELIASLGVNENKLEACSDLNAIVETIRNACGEEVFTELSIPTESPKSKPTIERKRNDDVVTPGSGKRITLDTTLKEIEELCEYPDFCRKLRDIKKTEDYTAGAFYYLFAVLLRGCDGSVCKYPSRPGEEAQISNRAKWNFGTYVVSKDVNFEQPVLNTGIFTWTTACRHLVGIEKSGNLGDFSKVFNKLDINTTLGEIKNKFENPSEAAYKTNKNDKILNAIERLKEIDISDLIIG